MGCESLKQMYNGTIHFYRNVYHPQEMLAKQCMGKIIKA